MSCTASAKETTATITGLLINGNNSGYSVVVDPQNFFLNVIIGGALSIWDRDNNN